jgi:hypothetical protein
MSDRFLKEVQSVHELRRMYFDMVRADPRAAEKLIARLAVDPRRIGRSHRAPTTPSAPST